MSKQQEQILFEKVVEMLGVACYQTPSKFTYEKTEKGIVYHFDTDSFGASIGLHNDSEIYPFGRVDVLDKTGKITYSADLHSQISTFRLAIKDKATGQETTFDGDEYEGCRNILKNLYFVVNLNIQKQKSEEKQTEEKEREAILARFKNAIDSELNVPTETPTETTKT